MDVPGKGADANRETADNTRGNGTLVTEFINPAQDPRWDSFVESHPFGWITHLSSWQKVLEGSFPHMKGHFPALVDSSSGAIRAALPVFEVKSWLIGNKLVSIPWATLCDPLVICRAEFELLAEATLRLREKLHAGHLEIRSLHTAELLNDGMPEIRPHFLHHYLSLEKDIDKIQKTFHRTCVQQRIRKAQESELTLQVGDSPEHLDILYAMHLKNRKQKRLPPQPHLFFKNMWEILSQEKKISLLIAQYRGEPIATLLLFKFKGRISAEVAQIDESFRNMSPNIFLFWEAIKQGVQENYRIFDFGRTAPNNQTLLDFKSRWGTSVSNIYCFYYPVEKGQGVIDSYSKRYKLLQLLCHYTPEFVQPYIGGFCYRHTG